MNFINDRYADLREIARDMGNQSFRFGGNDVQCIPTSLEDGTTIIRGGFEHQIDLKLIILASDFPTWGDQILLMGNELYTMGDVLEAPAVGSRAIPLAGQTLEFWQRNYRIVSAKASADRQHHELLCADMNSGR